MIVAAIVGLVQLDALRSGRPSPLATAVSSTASFVQLATADASYLVRDVVSATAELPRLTSENRRLADENRTLRAQDARFEYALSAAPAARAFASALAASPGAIDATVIGYDPESVTRAIAIDRGSLAGVKPDDGVLTPDGVVGRVTDVAPFSSTVLLLTDAGSKVPALIARGRWWGIANGTNTRVALRYVSQDAKLRPGDRVVTGRGRSFRAGIPIGRVIRIDHPQGALYQTAILAPAVAFGRLERVVVAPAP